MDTSVSDASALWQRVTRVLLDRRVDAGHWEGYLSSSALATATAVTAVATAARAGLAVPDAERLVNAGIAWLAATRNEDGGWGDTPDSVSNISTTALVWAALSFAPRIGDSHQFPGIGDSHQFGEPAGATGGCPQFTAVATSAEAWLARAAGGPEPRHLASALAARYGKDRTFSVPILTMCAIAGRLGPPERAWALVPQLPFELAVLPRRFFGALRLPVVSYALPALISMGLARHRAGRAIPLVSGIRELAARRTLDVLTTLQPHHGGFLEAVPLTSFVAMSLVAAGEREHPALRRGLAFLVGSVRPDGSWPIDTNLATWITTLAVNALAAGPSWSDLTADDRRRLRDGLLDQQWRVEHPYTGAAPGGWAWTDLPGGVPDADDTAGALLALAHLDPDDARVRAAAADGTRWLLNLQNADGGIPTFCRGWGTLPFDRSSTDITAHALRAWSAWSDHFDATLNSRVQQGIRRGVTFLRRAQRDDGAFVPLWFGNQREPQEENPVFGTSRILKGLAAVQSRAPEAQTIAARATCYLLDAQNADGGWGGARGVRSSIEETATALAGLAAGTTSRDADALRRGAAWLREATRGFTHFPAEPLGLYFARLWYSEELYPLVFSADALGRLHRPLSSQH